MLDTVLFDMGGTLEDISYDEATARKVTLRLMEMLRAKGLLLTETPEAFWEKVDRGVKRYKAWSQSVDLELKPEDIWPDFYLREFDFDRETIVDMSEELASMWEVTYFNRKLRPGVVEMLDALKARGYKLGIISNTAALYSVFHVLEEYGIRQYFEDVTLSSVTGYRKPHEGIFRISLYEMRSLPENSVYVGDTMSRDVIGSKRAGFAVAVQIKSFMTGPSDTKVQQSAYQPDYVITDFTQLVQILDEIRESESNSAG
ncbi:MAG: HAD family hydrolase [Clostridiaceae bacterium]|nr:HAD family hydrolase [Clostridiaceae bacterium]